VTTSRNQRPPNPAGRHPFYRRASWPIAVPRPDHCPNHCATRRQI